MAGFDYIEDMAPEEESGGAPAPAAPLVYGQAPAGAKPARYAVPTPKTGVPISPSILEDMERIYQQKVASRNPFVEWMKDVSAWGGLGRPGSTQEALSKRRESKEAEAAELFRMRSDMAAIRAQQEQAARAAEFLKGKVGVGGAPGAQGAPSTSGLPSHIAEQISDMIGMGDVAGAQKVYNEYMKTFTTENVKRTQGPDYDVKKNEIIRLDPKTGKYEIDMVSNRELDEDPSLRGSLRKPATAPAPVAPAAAPTPPAARAPAAPAAPAKPPVNYTYDELSPQDIDRLEARMREMGIDPRDSLRRPDAAEAFNKNSLEKRKQVFEVLAQAPQAAPAPAQKPAPAAPARRVPTIPELKAEAEAVKKERDVIAAKEGEQFNSFLTSIDAPVATDRAETAKEIIELTKTNPRVVGILQAPGVAPALATLLQSGISISGGHSIGMKELDEALFRARPGTTPQDIEARERLKTLLEKTAFHLSNIIKGQGQVTEFERTLLQQVAGSVRTTPGNIVKIQNALLARAELDQRLGEMYNRRPQGMTFSQFKGTDAYKTEVKAYEDRLREIQKEKITFPSQAPAGAPKSGTTPGGVKWKVVPQ